MSEIHYYMSKYGVRIFSRRFRRFDISKNIKEILTYLYWYLNQLSCHYFVALLLNFIQIYSILYPAFLSNCVQSENTKLIK